MKEVSKIIIHCSATPDTADITAQTINTWHLKRGFRKIGYHFFIRRNGTLETGRTIHETGAHAKGHNHDSIGICLAGGVTEQGQLENNFVAEQLITLASLCRTLKTFYPEASVIGHRDLPNVHKSCPCFNVSRWWNE